MSFIRDNRLVAQVEAIENGFCVHYMDIVGESADGTVEKTVFCKTSEEIQAAIDQAIDSRPPVLRRQQVERERRKEEEVERLRLEARANGAPF